MSLIDSDEMCRYNLKSLPNQSSLKASEFFISSWNQMSRSFIASSLKITLYVTWLLSRTKKERIKDLDKKYNRPAFSSRCITGVLSLTKHNNLHLNQCE